MSDVFISYSRKDKDFVRQLHDAFAKLHREAWVDWQDIAPTAEWQQEIYAGIESADNFLFVISPDSVVSEACQNEVAHAAKNNKRLVPLLRHSVPDAEIPKELAKINFVYFAESDPFDATFKSLVDTLDADLGWIRSNTRLLVRAKEWEQKNKNKSFLLTGEDLREAEKWQAEAGTKEPRATTLHAQYILASRQAETRRQRITLGAVMGALTITILLAVVAVFQRNTARQQTAIAQARQLAAQAELVRATSPELSALFSVESDHLAPVAENVPVLQRTLPLLRKSVAVLPHKQSVQALAFSPDGQWLATGSEDRMARVFAFPSGKELVSFRHGELVASVAFSPDGKYFATGSWDGGAYVFDLEAEAAKPLVLKHGGRVDKVAFSPDSRYLATASWDKNAYIYELPSGQLVGRVPHKGIVVSVAWDSSSRYVVTAGFDSQANVFDVVQRNVVQTLPHQGSVQDVTFSPDGRYIASASWDASARIFDAQTGKLISRIPSANQRMEAVAFSPDGKYLCVGGDDNSVRVLTVPAAGEIFRFEHQLGVNAVAWSPDGRYAASGSSDGTAVIFEARRGKVIARIEHPGKESGVNGLAFSPDGEYLVTSSFDNTARISRVLDSAPGMVRLEHQGNLLTITFDAHGDHLATGNWDGTVIVSDTRSGSQLTKLKMEGAIYGLGFSRDSQYVGGTADGVPGEVQVAELRGTKPPLTLPSKNGSRVVAFTPDNQYVAQVSEENVVQLFGLHDGKPAVRFEHQKPDTGEEIHAIAFSPDGKYLLTSRTDALVRTFDTATGKEQARFSLERIPLAMSFSEDGHYVAARLSDNSGLVFQPPAGKIVTRLQPSGGVLAVALSPDARFVATGGNDHAAQVFDTLHGALVARIECAGPVKAVAFSADGNYLISAAVENEGSEDVNLAVQRNFWRHQDLGMQACARLNRNFSPQEWQQYFPGQEPRKTCPNLP
jgi:WD40 repeat protein